ncbi:MAG: Gfo/Idh/MocA family oxidoreductase [bacterium]|nr:Gfo/Idh/MocA family oxidoreductase [bacterium]
MKGKKVCLIGLGNIGMVHLEAYLKLENVDLTIVDINADVKKISMKYSLKYFSQLCDALEYNFDIIDICTPTYLHYTQIKLCLAKSNAIIFCEKPLTTSLIEVIDLLKISKNKKRLILCAMVERFNDPFIRIKRELKKINGPFKIILIRRTKKFRNNSWFEKENLGGDIINDLGVHDIDLSMYLTNESIFSSSIKNIDGSSDKVVISLKMSKGSNVSITLKRDLLKKNADGVQNICKVFYKNKEIIFYKSDNEILVNNIKKQQKIKVKKRFPMAYDNEVHSVLDIAKGKKSDIFPPNKQLLGCIQVLSYLNNKYEK